MNIVNSTDLVKEWESGKHGNATGTGFRWAMPWLERRLGQRMMDGSLTIIGGRDGTGKSFFALHLLHLMAQLGQRGHFISLEDPPAEMARRLALGLAHPNLSVSFPHSGGVLECAATMEKLACVCVVDYVQTCTYDVHEAVFSREGQVAGVAQHLKRTARRLNIPVILTSQVGRPFQGQDPYEVPSKHQLAESSRLEKPSEYVLMLGPEADHEHLVVEIAKAKDAKIGYRTRLRRGLGGRLEAPVRVETEDEELLT